MNDDWLEAELHRSLRLQKDCAPPAFDEVMAAAEHRVARRSRWRGPAAGVAAAVAMAFLWFDNASQPVPEPAFDFAIEAALKTGTFWQAPSDALMPTHPFDLYESLPVPAVSTEYEEGTLL